MGSLKEPNEDSLKLAKGIREYCDITGDDFSNQIHQYTQRLWKMEPIAILLTEIQKRLINCFEYVVVTRELCSGCSDLMKKLPENFPCFDYEEVREFIYSSFGGEVVIFPLLFHNGVLVKEDSVSGLPPALGMLSSLKKVTEKRVHLDPDVLVASKKIAPSNVVIPESESTKEALFAFGLTEEEAKIQDHLVAANELLHGLPPIALNVDSNRFRIDQMGYKLQDIQDFLFARANLRNSRR